MADTAIENLSNFLREELPKVLHESLPLVAPFFKDIVSSSVGVKRDPESPIGRDWKVTHLYDCGISGLMKYADPLGPAMVATSATSLGKMGQMLQFVTAAASTPFPTATESPHAGSLKRQLALHMTTGNFSVPVAWMQADALNATQIKTVARDIKAVGKLRAMVEATGFHSMPITNSSSTETKVLGAVTSLTDDAAGTTYTSGVIRITLNEKYGTVHNFRPGMMVDIIKGNGAEGGALQCGATAHSDVVNYDGASTPVYVHVMVHKVDYIGRTIDIIGINSGTGVMAAYDTTNGWDDGGVVAPIAAHDYIVMRGCSSVLTTRPMPTWGMEDWMKTTGNLMGGSATSEALSLSLYPQFKSSVTAINGPLTEDVLNKNVGDYLDAYPGLSLDTILTSNGVTQKYLQQYGLYNNRQFFDRAGKSLDVKGGWANVAYEFNGRVVRWIVDPLCVKNRLYCLKLSGGNIKRYAPPTISSSDSRLNSSAGMDGEIQFLAPLGGHTGIFMVARGSSGQVLDILEAPFYQYSMIAPIDPRGIKLTGLTEA